MSGTIGGVPASPVALTDQQNASIKTMQDTYAQAQEFDAQVTALKMTGDSVLDAVKQRPQV